MNKILNTFFDMLSIISTLIILFSVMLAGIVILGMPMLVVLFLISILF